MAKGIDMLKTLESSDRAKHKLKTKVVQFWKVVSASVRDATVMQLKEPGDNYEIVPTKSICIRC